MDEYIDLLDNEGNLTGKSCLKSEAHKKGLLHGSTHIWVFNNQKNIIIQKRAANKDTFPNLWDVSAAGHISAGEKPIISAVRELEEEIGIRVLHNQLNYIGIYKKKIHHNTNLIDNEIHHIYICSVNFDFSTLKIQEEEVSEIKIITIDNLIKRLKLNNKEFVPHGEDYYKLVLEKIKNYTS
ncbi:NUDIX domain-containing protein [uncultured Lutibacter sp.]|uniref:NUDIX hydrolase n=1 Tax=uncultured Lutibacter sp. TaxID=437739 RepID=UPI002610A030|nr:NUDIX domain-containing protein [uncultured Lutibacter sp.]